MQYTLGSWYRRDELGKRACLFLICSALGQMVSGYLMAGVHHLGGVGGYKGWQWCAADHLMKVSQSLELTFFCVIGPS